HIPTPLYGNLSFTHNHNTAGDIGRSVGGNSHIGTHTHGTVGFHGSSASITPGSGVFTRASADMCIPGYGNTGTHGHGAPDMFVYDDQNTSILLPDIPVAPLELPHIPNVQPHIPTVQPPLSLPSEDLIPPNNEPSLRRS
ncbi:hypothetical protein MTR67_005575, partial [Solanum verrucosum]